MNKTICLYNGTVFTGVAFSEHSTVMIEDNKIADIVTNARFKKKPLPKNTVVIDMQGAYVSPGFIDTHIHGLHGHDTSDASVDAILEMSKALVNYGVTAFCPTLYPQEDTQFIKCIEAVRDAMGKEEGAKIIGLHLEGPFVSRDKMGVLNPEYMRQVDMNLMKQYWEASNGTIVIMTVAPELKNMREIALFGSKKGIVMSSGHSNATYENILDAMQAGILHSTHFFNAMRRIHHRDPGVVGAILIHPNVSCEIIADGYHVHPALIKLLLNVKPIHKIILVTDALRPTMQSEGKMLANNEEVYLKDGVFHRKSDDTIAGSALTMIQGVKYLNSIGVSLDNAMRMASCNPATVLSLQKESGYILPGKNANITVFDKDYNIKMVMVNGDIKKNDFEYAIDFSEQSLLQE